MHIFVNALAASAGSGPTYVRNVVPYYAATPNVKTTFLLRPELRRELGSYDNVFFEERDAPARAGRRFLFEQRILPELLRRGKADVLISAGNFALRASPVPQILLSGNSLYISPDFYRDLRRRRDYKLWLDTKIKGFFAKSSVGWANVTVSPTAAFAQQLQAWAGGKVIGIHHGFDRNTFFGSGDSLPRQTLQKLESAQGSLRLLFVSHYNYYRNFETLFRGIALLREKLPRRKISLVLTCTLRSEENPGDYGAESAAALLRQLGIQDQIVELGAVPYRLLHHVYQACDVYVSAAYAESFAHPLVEAMASGLPVVASDLAVHREVCGDAALYFERFSADEFSARILRIAHEPDLAKSMSEKGQRQAEQYSWSRHVSELISLASSLRSSSRMSASNKD
jgi:glycosyltransferase involved in cell wall biosynthesis